MYTLGIKRGKEKLFTRKTVLVYIILTAAAVLVNRIYAYFGHGVHSNKMTYMFLYPLIGGALYYLAIGSVFSKTNRLWGYRLFYNMHNTGIATLTAGSFLNGILEIAGTGSEYVKWFYLIGWLFVGSGLILLISSRLRVGYKLKH